MRVQPPRRKLGGLVPVSVGRSTKKQVVEDAEDRSLGSGLYREGLRRSLRRGGGAARESLLCRVR